MQSAKPCSVNCLTTLTQTSEEQRLRAFAVSVGVIWRNMATYPNRYIVSAAFRVQVDPLLMALEETTANVPELTVAACERFFGLAAEDMPNMNGIDTGSVANLVLRAYSQTSDQRIKTRCLDLIDRMHFLGTYGLDRVMEAIDR